MAEGMGRTVDGGHSCSLMMLGTPNWQEASTGGTVALDQPAPPLPTQKRPSASPALVSETARALWLGRANCCFSGLRLLCGGGVINAPQKIQKVDSAPASWTPTTVLHNCCCFTCVLRSGIGKSFPKCLWCKLVLRSQMRLRINIGRLLEREKRPGEKMSMCPRCRRVYKT